MSNTISSGAGFVSVDPCPDCNHTRCGDECACECISLRLNSTPSGRDPSRCLWCARLLGSVWSDRTGEVFCVDGAIHSVVVERHRVTLAGRLGTTRTTFALDLFDMTPLNAKALAAMQVRAWSALGTEVTVASQGDPSAYVAHVERTEELAKIAQDPLWCVWQTATVRAADRDGALEKMRNGHGEVTTAEASIAPYEAVGLRALGLAPNLYETLCARRFGEDTDGEIALSFFVDAADGDLWIHDHHVAFRAVEAARVPDVFEAAGTHFKFNGRGRLWTGGHVVELGRESTVEGFFGEVTWHWAGYAPYDPILLRVARLAFPGASIWRQCSRSMLLALCDANGPCVLLSPCAHTRIYDHSAAQSFDTAWLPEGGAR